MQSLFACHNMVVMNTKDLQTKATPNNKRNAKPFHGSLIRITIKKIECDLRKTIDLHISKWLEAETLSPLKLEFNVSQQGCF